MKNLHQTDLIWFFGSVYKYWKIRSQFNSERKISLKNQTKDTHTLTTMLRCLEGLLYSFHASWASVSSIPTPPVSSPFSDSIGFYSTSPPPWLVSCHYSPDPPQSHYASEPLIFASHRCCMSQGLNLSPHSICWLLQSRLSNSQPRLNLLSHLQIPLSPSDTHGHTVQPFKSHENFSLASAQRLLSMHMNNSFLSIDL